MKRVLEWLASGLVTLSAATLGAFALVWWLALPPMQTIAERVPLAHGATDGVDTADIDIEGAFTSFHAPPPLQHNPFSWPGFRGPRFDNISREPVALAETWPSNGPPVLWSLDLGQGYAGAAIRDGLVYILDYDEEKKGDCLRCFVLADGKELWRRCYEVTITPWHGISRSVPAVTEKYVVTFGPRAHVMCVDARTGAFRWGIDMIKEYGGAIPDWHTAQCPLIDNGIAVLAPAGSALLMGVDCATGKIVWQTSNPHEWDMSHASVVPATFAGKKMYIYAAVGGLIGVSADAENRGAVLWETTEWRPDVAAPCPVFMEDGKLFVTAGYGAGSAMFQLSVDEEGQFAVKKLYEMTSKVFACEQHTPVYYEGCLFTILPKDAGLKRRQFACLRPGREQGDVVWLSGKQHRFGLGPFMVADGKFLLLDDKAVLTLAKADATGYVQLAQAKIFDGKEAWAPLAISDGKLLLRDIRRMVCLDLRKK